MLPSGIKILYGILRKVRQLLRHHKCKNKSQIWMFEANRSVTKLRHSHVTRSKQIKNIT